MVFYSVSSNIQNKKSYLVYLQCWVVTRYRVTRYCNVLLLGVTRPVTRYYWPGVTLAVTSYFLK